MAERKTGRELQAELLERAVRDAAFRRALVSDPRGVLEREFGVTIPETVQLSVLEESPRNLYLVLPPARSSTDRELSDTELDGVAGGLDADGAGYDAPPNTFGAC
jgi:hypothetical protein